MSDRKPMVLVLAGPNGSGKSTITRFFDIVGSYTNADDMVAATGMSNEDAAKLADKMRYHSIEVKEDFTFETVLSPLQVGHTGKSKIGRLFHQVYFCPDY